MPYKVFFPVHHVARAILLISLHSATLVIAAAQDPPKPQEKPKSEEEVKKEATEKVQKDLTNAQGKRIPAVTPSADQNPSNLSTGSRGLQGQDVPIIRVRQAEARQAETRGDWNEAFALHKQAIDIAKQENNKEAIADASLRYARAYEFSAAQAGTGTPSLDEAAKIYREVINIGTPGQRSLAQNNLGALLLQQGKPKEALEVLQAISYADVTVPERYIYSYNIGRAHEESGDKTSAFKLYEEALSSQPGFAPAIDGAFRVAWGLGPQGLNAIADLARQLIQRGQTEHVEPRLRESLKVWAADPQLPRLLAQLVRCYAELSIDDRSFEKTEWPAMLPLVDGQSGILVREIRLAFVGPLVPAFYAPYEQGPIRAWREERWKVQPYSMLLRRMGDTYRRRGELSNALARYALAWSLNRDDVQAALYAADLLQEEAQTLDRDGRLLNQFIEKLFESKAEAYSGGDWLNILRLHTVLGTIYARQEKWGTPSDPRGALFQFEHAHLAEKEYRAKNPGFPESPGLNTQLGDIYMHLNRPGDAGRQYLAAAKVYVREGRGKEAREILDRVRPIQTDLSPEELHGYLALEDRVKTIPMA